jgi:hypothetical protein
MIKLVLLSLAFILTFVDFDGSANASAHVSECKFTTAAKVLEDSPGLHLSVREQPSSTTFFKTDFTPSGTLQTYRSAVSTSVSPEPFELLRRYLPRATRAEDARNVELILDQRAGFIRRINCMEALLLEEQIKRTPLMETNPTEFLATFLTDGERVRVYFLTNDSVGVGGIARLYEEIERDVQQGWRVESNLHNHSFFLDDLKGSSPQGVLAPSASDIHALKSQADHVRLKRALITNGFHTLSIDSSEFAAFEPTPPNL